MYTWKWFEVFLKKDEHWFTFSGHTKIRHQSHSAFWKSCLFGIIYRIIFEARWEAVTRITKAWLPLQVFHFILGENSTLSFGGGFFCLGMFLANQQQVTPEASGTPEVRMIQVLSPWVRSRTPAWVSQSFKSPGHPLGWVFLLPNYKVLDLTTLLH